MSLKIGCYIPSPPLEEFTPPKLGPLKALPSELIFKIFSDAEPAKKILSDFEPPDFLGAITCMLAQYCSNPATFFFKEGGPTRCWLRYNGHYVAVEMIDEGLAE
ncbi:hypothetical protein [Parachlamydia sp. AcF125]|uniref:hypothetical protein n=1 Tax=Parachlamydia sp. AcF125 TaxID=2795736 RepID=UPI001BC8F260|nr:hypothetical protein [Parachlamydia sp. AcF125]MBS4167791.1 hypothetical protein [Parachlamydia sp. AcF125]